MSPPPPLRKGKGRQAGKAIPSAKPGLALGAQRGTANQSSALGAQRGKGSPDGTANQSSALGAQRGKGSQDGTASQGSALGATKNSGLASRRGKGFAQDGTAKQGSASSVDGSASQGSAPGVDVTADFVVLGAKGGSGGEPGTKKLRGNEYECAECAISYPHKEMIKSVRLKHAVKIKPEAAPGDAAMQDALGQKRFQDLQWEELKKVCRKIARTASSC